MRKWPFFCFTAAAVAIIGCGGSSHSTSSGTTGAIGTTGTGPTSVATVTLPSTYGLVYVGFLTGAGRATGDLYLTVENIILNDSYDNITAQRQNASSPLVMDLSSYNFLMTTIDVQLGGINSRLFDSATIVPYSFSQELNQNGTPVLNPLAVLQQNEPTNVVNGTPLPLFAATTLQPSTRLRVFPGRDSVIPVFFDQTMFAIDGSGLNVGLVPDPSTTVTATGTGNSLFSDTNEPQNNIDPTTSGKVAGYLSDMVEISLTNVNPKHIPTAAQAGIAGTPTDFYLSGDRYAIGSSKVSNPTNTNPNFAELTLDPTTPITGIVGQPGQILSTQFQFGSGFPGTYDLLQQNPSIFQTAEITSLFGRWRGISSNIGTPSNFIPLVDLRHTSFDLIVFPNSNESYTYASPADVIAIVHSGTTITDLYIGYAWYTGGPNKQVAGARVYPLSSFVTASIANEVDFSFTLGSFTGVGGLQTTDEPSIRNGAYTITSATVPTGFPVSKSGTFVVFRQ